MYISLYTWWWWYAENPQRRIKDVINFHSRKKKKKKRKSAPAAVGCIWWRPSLAQASAADAIVCVYVCLPIMTFQKRIYYLQADSFFSVCVCLVGLFHTTWARSHTQHSLGLCWLDTFSWPRLNESRYLYRNKLSIHFTRRYVQKNVFECMGTRYARSSFIIAKPFFSSSSNVYTRMHQPAGQRWPILLLPQVYYLCRHASLSHTAYTHRGQGRFLKIIIIISCWMSLARRTCLFSSSSSSPLYWICKTIVCVCLFGNRRCVGPALCGGSRRTY